jgi:uncharacterized membrane protein
MPSNFTQLVFRLFLAGFALIFVGIILIAIASIFSGNHDNFGGVIVIGPILIIFGAGENVWLLALAAAVLTIVCLILFFLQKRQKQDAS